MRAARAVNYLQFCQTEAMRRPDLFIVALKDFDAGVRAVAAESLRFAPAKDAGPALTAALADPDAGVRKAAADALSAVRDHSPYDPAIAANLFRLLSDEDGTTRDYAARVLGQIRARGPATDAALEKMARDDPAPFAKGCAAEALAFIRTDRHPAHAATTAP